MESYAGVLSDDNIWRVVAFIRSLSSTTPTAGPPKGDASKGRDLFWGKGQCGGCHMVDTKGGRSGPNLSRVGRQRSLAFLRESITNPSAEITPGYSTVAVVLRDGKQITGLERGLDNFTVQLIDLSGRFYSFDKSQVASVKRETRSLMPPSQLAPAELDDLVAYLATLRGGSTQP